MAARGPEDGLVPLARVGVLGTRVTVSTFASAQEALVALVREGAPRYVSPANVYSVTFAHGDPSYQAALNGAHYVTTDGMPIVWALRVLGHHAERVHNDDLFMACCERFPTWRHFLVGGNVGQPEKVAEAMRRRFPDIEIVGTHPTPERPVPPAETERIIQEIRRTRPSIVWVGMGTPAQDHWMAQAVPLAGTPMMGVGSLFDVLSGRTRPAPGWMKRYGLQWLFRLSQEPRRLGARYTYYSFRFVIAFGLQLARRSVGPR
jgi:N-acetylglucosaminyldiphosphoundecaprenol N-acetyl-beta-D-mannosaminyltransferase